MWVRRHCGYRLCGQPMRVCWYGAQPPPPTVQRWNHLRLCSYQGVVRTSLTPTHRSPRAEIEAAAMNLQVLVGDRLDQIRPADCVA